MAYRHKRSKPSGGFLRNYPIAKPAYLRKFDFTKDKQAMLAKKVNVLSRKIATVHENKYVDGVRSGTIQDVSGTDATWASTEANPSQNSAAYGCLPIPVLGQQYSERDGRRIYVKNIRIKGVIRWNPIRITTATGNFANFTRGPIRLVVVKDKRTNGATLNGEDVIGAGEGSDGNVIATDQSAISLPTNLKGWGRYEIMKDRTYYPKTIPTLTVGVGDGTASDDQLLPGYELAFKMNIKANCYVNFDGDTGLIASVIDNSFHMLAAESDQGGGDCSLEYYARTSFVG